MCEHAFVMASSGSAYGRFRRALDNGNLLAARAAATELEHGGLAEALFVAISATRCDWKNRPPCSRSGDELRGLDRRGPSRKRKARTVRVLSKRETGLEPATLSLEG